MYNTPLPGKFVCELSGWFSIKHPRLFLVLLLCVNFPCFSAYAISTTYLYQSCTSSSQCQVAGSWCSSTGICWKPDGVNYVCQITAAGKYCSNCSQSPPTYWNSTACTSPSTLPYNSWPVTGNPWFTGVLYMCTSGQYSLQDGQCITCPDGYYCPNIIGTTLSDVLFPCPVGYGTNIVGGNCYSSSQCVPCTNTIPSGAKYLPGYYTSCPFACTSGSYSSGALCPYCAAGTWSASGATVCSSCTNTYPLFASYSGVGATSATNCSWSCNTGYKLSPDTTKCATPCSNTSYTLPNGTCAKCTVCAPGSYVSTNCSAYVDANCSACPSSFYSAANNSISCMACTTVLGTACAPGNYVVANCTAKSDLVCQPCPAGTYSYMAGLSACIPCDLGTYGPSSGLTACSICTTGARPPAPHASIPPIHNTPL